MRKSVTFTARTYANRLDAFIAACGTIDAANRSNAKAINGWAQMAAAGLSTNCMTLEQVKEGVIARYPKAATLADCGDTVKGRFYAFQRIANAGSLDRLIAGEALNTVARDCKPKQEQKAGKRAAKGKGDKAKTLSLNDCIAGLSYWMDTAIADGDKARELASNPKLVALVGKFAELDKAANRKAAAKPKAQRGNIKALATAADRAGSGKVVRKPRKAVAVARKAA